jgi:hypothetical protein
MLNKLALSMCAIVLGTVTLPALAQTPQPPLAFTVCEGEYENQCQQPHDAYTYCGTINGWAQQACKIQNSQEVAKYQLIPLSSKSGNKCGYGLFRVICVR